MSLFENCKVGDKVYTKSGRFFGTIRHKDSISFSVNIEYYLPLVGWDNTFISYRPEDGSLNGIPPSLINMTDVHYVVPEHLVVTKVEEETIELYLDDEGEYDE
jgi:hypothetical protein